jgi:hypothetical protein
MVLGNRQIRRLAVWWLAVNSIGAAISIFIERYTFYRGARQGSFNAPSSHYEFIHIPLWLAGEIVIGALQVLTCCRLIFLAKARSRMFRVALGVTLGILTPLLFIFLPMFIVNSVLFLDPLIGIFAFLLSGIVFGAIAGYSQLEGPKQGSG